ncbi:GcrA family cell cycle regulator [Saccharibacter floricola]|uniref:GcrA family cell cycle regulator n=1 Tax=Saccharibacter floricola TaxID=231053 RepID=UPI000377F5F0|nr:GcrA family cell cycle regulator [Saccharibacter floricola]
MEWTEELIARLRDLWSQGLSTAEIGRQLSITKNAVVGKAHRLELPPRPSPIRNRSSEDGSTPPRKRSTTSRKKKTSQETASLPLEGGKSAPSSEEKKVSAAKEAPSSPAAVSGEKGAAPTKPAASRATTASTEPTRPVAPPRKMAPPRRVREAMDRATRRGPSCQWPHGDPGTPGFHFCGATPLPGKPYCAEHAAVAYVKIRDRRH